MFAVDWHGGSINYNYLQAAADTRLVGRIIADFIKNLDKVYGVSPSRVTIIGHSLGGQIPGFVGKEVRSPKIGRIICMSYIGSLNSVKLKSIYFAALDPAKPFYESKEPTKRLDSEDADVVEVILTNSGSMSSEKTLGHVANRC